MSFRVARIILALLLFLMPVLGVAQPIAKMARIGFLSLGPRPDDGLPPLTFRKVLEDLGYVDGKNLTFISRWAEVKLDRLPTLAAEMVSLKVDVIVTMGAPTADVVKQATSTVPVVMAAAGDALGTGLIASLARPGGNITGNTIPDITLSPKRMELLKEAVPSARRIAVLWNKADRAMTLRYEQIEAAARTLRVSVQPLAVREPEDFETAFANMMRDRPDALFLIVDTLTNVHRKRVIEFTMTHRIPAMSEFGWIVQDGLLMSYGQSLDDNFRKAATYVDKILKGAKPAISRFKNRPGITCPST